MTEKALILGSTGFIGNSLLKYLNSINFPVIGLSSQNCDFSNLNSLNDVLKGNLKNSTIIYCAGKHRQYGDNEKNYKKNKKIIINLLSIFKKNIPKKFIFLSTVEVYGNKSKNLITEESKIDPLNLYAKGKYEQEKLIQHFCQKYKIRYYIIRIPGIFGKADRKTSVISKIIHSINENKSLNFDTDLNEQRDYVYIVDLIKNLYHLIISKSSSGTYNLVSGKSFKIKEIIRLIEKIYKKKLKISKKKFKGFNLKFSNKKIKKNFKEIKFKSLSESIKHYKKKYVTCILGYGPWAKKIIKILNKKDSVFKIRGICKKNKLLNKKNIIFYTNFKSMVSKIKPEVIFLISTPQVNSICLQYLKKNNSAIFIEKPVALNKLSLRKIAPAFKLKKLIHTNYMDIYNPINSEILYKTESSRPIQLNCQLSSNKKTRKSHSSLWDYSPHHIALIISFYKKLPKKIKAETIRSYKSKKLHKIYLDFGKDYKISTLISGNGDFKSTRNYKVFTKENHTYSYDDIQQRYLVVKHNKKKYDFKKEIKLLDNSIELFSNKLRYNVHSNDYFLNFVVTSVLLLAEKSLKSKNWEFFK